MKLFAPTCTDFYKVSHYRMYPKDMETLYSNFTARFDKHAEMLSDFDHKVVVFGISGICQWFLRDMWNDTFFGVPKAKAVEKYMKRINRSLGPGAITSKHIEDLHDLGFLPLRIKALPEGSRVNLKVPVLTVTNSIPGFGWLVNYIESALSSELWKPMTTATTAYEYRRLLTKYAHLTGSPLEFVAWQGHDFAFRGLSGVFDAAQSAAGHLLSFYGTDTIPALDYLEEYYASAEAMIDGGSVAATEHSVTTSNIIALQQEKYSYLSVAAGLRVAELDVLKRLITEEYPSGVFSYVSDSFDYWNVISNISWALKQEILDRTPDALGLAKVVFRPDTGDPVEVLVGKEIMDCSDFNMNLEEAAELAADFAASDASHEQEVEKLFRFDGKVYKIDVQLKYDRFEHCYVYFSYSDPEEVALTPEQKGTVECLWDIFGGTITATGHKLLNPRVGVIYGDSITLKRAEAILEGLEAKGFASANVVFGIGSFTYQHVTRDTFGFAMKATHCTANGGKSIDIFKDPKTDASKKSAKGLLEVIQNADTGDFILLSEVTPEQEQEGLLQLVFENSKVYNAPTLVEIRKTLHGTENL